MPQTCPSMPTPLPLHWLLLVHTCLVGRGLWVLSLLCQASKGTDGSKLEACFWGAESPGGTAWMSKMRFCSGDLTSWWKIKRHWISYFSNHCDKILGQKPLVEEGFILALVWGQSPSEQTRPDGRSGRRLVPLCLSEAESNAC